MEYKVDHNLFINQFIIIIEKDQPQAALGWEVQLKLNLRPINISCLKSSKHGHSIGLILNYEMGVGNLLLPESTKPEIRTGLKKYQSCKILGQKGKAELSFINTLK